MTPPINRLPNLPDYVPPNLPAWGSPGDPTVTPPWAQALVTGMDVLIEVTAESGKLQIAELQIVQEQLEANTTATRMGFEGTQLS